MSLKHVTIILLVVISTFLFLSVFSAHASQSEQHIKVSLRMIGHELLLSSGDSTSRVLPIKLINDRYIVPFESDLGFNPDDLVNIANRNMKEAKVAPGYIVEVQECETGDVVYSYEMGDLENIDIIPCKSRVLPSSCYQLSILLLHNTPGPKEALIANNKVVTHSGFFEKVEWKYLFFALLIAMVVVVLIVIRKWQKQPSSNPNLINLGQYKFDKHNTELLFDQQRIELTSKEADLLTVLHGDANETVDRDVILKRVWGDDGDYVGRTLDVFISKLRKKLEADPNLKIVNVRGVGYKLVLGN